MSNSQKWKKPLCLVAEPKAITDPILPDLKDHIDRVGIEFYSRWKDSKLGDVITFQRSHDLTKTEMREGHYPVAGSNGIVGYHNLNPVS